MLRIPPVIARIVTLEILPAVGASGRFAWIRDSKMAAVRARGSTESAPRLTESTITSRAASGRSEISSANRSKAARSRSSGSCFELYAVPICSVPRVTISSKVAKKHSCFEQKLR